MQTADKVHIRPAAPTDSGALFRLAAVGVAETRYDQYGVSQEKLDRLMQTAMQNPGMAVLLVAEKGGAVCGFLYGAVIEHPFCPIVYAASIAFYVEPKSRGVAGRKLVEAFELAAEARGAQEIIMATSSGVDAARTVQFYRALGYTAFGALMLKHLGE